MPFNPTDNLSVYSRSRPVRIAFIIDVANCPPELQRAILQFNSTLWGGRLNPIIPVDNGSIPIGYWTLLKAYDPDVIYSYAVLDENLIWKIDREISPFHFIIHKDFPDQSNRYRPSIQEEYFKVDFSVVPIGARHLPGGKSSLLICHNYQDWPWFDFFQSNFGVYNDNSMYVPPSELERFVIEVKDEPINFLDKIAQGRRQIIYPWQFTASQVILKEFHNHRVRMSASFTFVIGDSVWDWLFFWNRALLVPAWKRMEMNQFYMPVSMADSLDLYPVFRKLVSLYAYRTENYSPTVVFASSSVPETKLKDISQKLTEKLDAMPHVQVLSSDLNELKDAKEDDWLISPRYPQHDYVNGEKFYLKPTHPPLQSKVNRGKWLVDFKIEYRPKKFSYINTTYWWKLPRVSSLARCFIDSGASGGRIDCYGHISTIVDGNSATGICFHIPDDASVVNFLLMRYREFFFRDDVRSPAVPIKPIYGDVRLSDKGRYFNGFINLVDNIFHAGNLVEHHFWRKILEEMCGVNNDSEKSVSSIVEDKLKKVMPAWFTQVLADKNKQDECIQRASKYFAALAVRLGRNLKMPDIDITFSRLLEKLTKERGAFIAMPQHTKGFETSDQRNKEDLLDVLTYLLETKIFIQGIKPSCRKCGFQTWHPADDVNFEVRCNGCQHVSALPPETQWVYRLNSLVQDVVRHHGTFPVVWVLSRLLWDSRESFIYRPSLELREDSDSRILAEIDLACISDGRFYIGEVKTHASQFSSHEITKLCDVAKNVLPDGIVIGAFEPPYDSLASVKAEILKELKDFNIRVIIKCPSGDFNEPEFHLSF